MRAIFRHELSSYFSNVSGYVFGAFLLLFAGIYCMVYNIQSALVNFEYVIGGMSFVFLVIVPILTMRVLAEERRQKTDQLLYSLPLTMTKVVLGKYAAMLVVFLVPLLIIGLYPLILTSFGTVNLRATYASVTGFFFLGASLISIGMYISSVTESQAVAAGLCFVVMLVNYFIADLASFASASAFGSLSVLMVLGLLAAGAVYLMTRNAFASLMTAAVLESVLMAVYLVKDDLYSGLVPKIMENLSLFERFYAMIDGVFDLTSIVYYLSVIGVFLFLSIQSMEKGRWSA